MTTYNFWDTNLLIYFFFDQSPKEKVLMKLYSQNPDYQVISTQVVNECLNVAMKKKLISSDQTILKQLIGQMESKFHIKHITRFDITLATEIHCQYKFSYFDSLIIATALNYPCSVLFTEDLHHRQILQQSLNVINLFLP